MEAKIEIKFDQTAAKQITKRLIKIARAHAVTSVMSKTPSEAIMSPNIPIAAALAMTIM
jgi:hypothetical protein